MRRMWQFQTSRLMWFSVVLHPWSVIGGLIWPHHVEIERQIQLHFTPNWNCKKRHIIFYNYSIYIIIDHYSIQQIVGSCQEPHLSNSPSISFIHDMYTSERFELTSFLLFWKCSGNFYICVLTLRYEGAFPCFPFPAKCGCEPVSTWWRIFKYRNHNPWLLSIPYFPKLKCGGSIVQYETSVHVWHFSIFVDQN